MNSPEGLINQVKRYAWNEEIDEDNHRNSEAPENVPRIIRSLEYHERTIQSVNAVNQEATAHQFIEFQHDPSSGHYT
jgi:hypothetical protein